MTWRFHSNQPRGHREVLPLWTARLAPKVDAHDINHDGGDVTDVLVTFEAAPGADTGRISQASLEVSTDDGATWTKGRLTAVSGRTYVAAFRTPAGPAWHPYGRRRSTRRATRWSKPSSTPTASPTHVPLVDEPCGSQDVPSRPSLEGTQIWGRRSAVRRWRSG
ncbi:hypothetical protein GCM10027569_76790 [Flindersiella endophytica]